MSTSPTVASEITTEHDGHVAILRFNRPEAMNTISATMLDQLCEHLLAADRDPNIRCIVLTGNGRAFCAGLDVKSQAEGTGMLSGVGSGGASELDLRHTPPTILHGLDTPTIAAVNGGAAGYGLDLALGCDIRLAAKSAKLSMAFAKRGILPESGGTWLLPRIVGYAKAAELSFTGRTLTADEALGYGLVNHVLSDDDFLSTAMHMAHEVAENAPLAVRAIKRMMRMAESETFEQNVHHVFLQLLPLLRTKDFQEGMMSYLERRSPVFEGR
jgi:enoyl-CoA hydratase/carnithine racemase